MNHLRYFPLEKLLTQDNGKSFLFYVGSGAGVNGTIVQPQIKEEVFEKYGYHFYPGSLNLKLVYKDQALTLKNEDYLQNKRIRMYKGKLNGFPVDVMMDANLPFPTDFLEICSPIKLRDYFGFETWDICILSINEKYLEKIS